MIVAQIRRVTTVIPTQPPPSYNPPKRKVEPVSTNFSEAIKVDPDNQLSPEQRLAFTRINQSYDNRFNPRYSRYNGNSGPYKASLVFGPVLPPPSKPCFPLYDQASLQTLQEEADKLEELGVLAKPEDVGVDVIHASPSFLRKKPDGSWRFITSFLQLGQFVKVPPSTHDTCEEVLRKLASWKFIIKTDLTAGFFQIPVTKSAMQYLGTVTPLRDSGCIQLLSWEPLDLLNTSMSCFAVYLEICFKTDFLSRLQMTYTSVETPLKSYYATGLLSYNAWRTTIFPFRVRKQ